MTTSTPLTTTLPDDAWRDALRAAAAFLAGIRSADTRKGYRCDHLLASVLRQTEPSPLHGSPAHARRGVPTPARAAAPRVGELDAAAADLDPVVVVGLARE